MASEEQLQIIRQGVDVWNEWRHKNPELIPDLDSAKLLGANLSGANLGGANLFRAKLTRAHLIESDLCDARLTGSYVHGVSVWDIRVDDHTRQQNLVITDPSEPVITVDDIEVAQFIYLSTRISKK